jgi:hypothetical protein
MLGCLGAILGPFWAVLRPSWGYLGSICGHIEVIMGHLGVMLAILGLSWAILESTLINFRGFLVFNKLKINVRTPFSWFLCLPVKDPVRINTVRSSAHARRGESLFGRLKAIRTTQNRWRISHAWQCSHDVVPYKLLKPLVLTPPRGIKISPLSLGRHNCSDRCGFWAARRFAPHPRTRHQ